MLLVGLTGGIGSGKSTVARLLAGRGAVVIDADALARDAVTSGTDGFRQVLERFGPQIVGADGELDRAALARIVFADPDRRQILEAIVHPQVQRGIAERIASQAGSDRIVVLDSPLLVETGAHQACDVVVVVRAPVPLRVQRLVARGMDETDVRARMDAQAPVAEAERVADEIVDNDGSQEDLGTRVGALWDRLAARAAG